MHITSTSWPDGARIPARYAAGKPDPQSHATFSDNVSPHFAWGDVPRGTKSFALLCIDHDVPSKRDDVNQPDREVPADLPRVDFVHWVMVDLPASLGEIAEGEFSSGFTLRGKPGPLTLHGARHGLNDYTGWSARDDSMRGQYHGWDGPFPPFNDARLHRYVFTLYALDVDKLAVDGSFTAAQAVEAMRGHVLAEATYSGTYSLNPRLVA